MRQLSTRLRQSCLPTNQPRGGEGDPGPVSVPAAGGVARARPGGSAQLREGQRGGSHRGRSHGQQALHLDCFVGSSSSMTFFALQPTSFMMFDIAVVTRL